MRDFMQRHVSDDWEIWLVLGKAIVPPDASREQVLASQQRAVALVRDLGPGWTDDDVGELIADARSRLWPSTSASRDGVADRPYA